MLVLGKKKTLRDEDFDDEGALKKPLKRTVLSVRMLRLRHREIKPLPDWVLAVEFAKCESLKRLPSLSPHLHRLVVSWCTALEFIPATLPSTLYTLHIDSCRKVELKIDLPPALHVLILKCIFLVHTLPPLPLTMRRIEVTYCPNFTLFPPIPLSMLKLNIDNCPLLVSLPPLPPGMKDLEVSWCKSFTALPDPLPLKMERLRCWCLPLLRSVPFIPSRMKKLSLYSAVSKAELVDKLALTMRPCKFTSALLSDFQTWEERVAFLKRVERAHARYAAIWAMRYVPYTHFGPDLDRMVADFVA